MNKKYILSPSGAIFRLLLVDLGMAFTLGLQTPKDSPNENYLGLIFFIPFVYFIILYFRYKLAFYFKIYLMNMYGATSISITDLANNVSKSKRSTRNIVKKIVNKQLLQGISYNSQTDIFDLKKFSSTRGRHFTFNIASTEQISFPFIGMLFIFNWFGMAFLGTGLSSINTDDIASIVLLFTVAAVLIFFTMARVYSNFYALKYMIIMIGTARISIQTLADRTKNTYALTNSNIHKLIQGRILNNVVISDDKEYLTLPEHILEALDKTTVPEPAIQDTAQPTTQKNQEIINKGRMYAKEIKKLNEELPDKVISTQLDKLEHITEQIFNFCEKNSIKDESIRKLLDYHLPTTLKLVSTYKDMDSMNSEIQNIESIKQEIRKSLDIIIKAFEQILDQLAENLRFNIEGEISALKTILEQDGLINNDHFDKSVKKGK